MRNNTEDMTLERNYLQKFRYMITEYEIVKAKKHTGFRFVKDFYTFHDTDRRSFLKYYNRYKQSGSERDLLPQKRGPRWKTRRPLPYIENKVVELRMKGNGRYEIVSLLKPLLKQFTPSPSGAYNIFRRMGLHRLTPVMKKEKRAIIKVKAGEMGHVDCHYLNKGIIQGDTKKYFLVCVVDDCTRVAWAEVVEDLTALTVMFTTLRILNIISEQFQIKFAEMLSDNGPEFGTRKSKQKDQHPFERMLKELGIKHRYTRPYRPQTNGKVERLWRTLEDDLLRDTTFNSKEELCEELLQYLTYYNYERPHQSLNALSPVQFSKNCPRIT